MAGDAGEALYEFVPGGNACDICASMAGSYAEPPAVPVHDHCNCIVVGPDEECEEEIRNIQETSDEYEFTFEVPFDNCGRPADTARVEVSDTPTFSYHDDPEMAECGAGDAGGGDVGEADVPANSSGTISYTVQVRATMCMGEKWRVCTSSDPVAGTHRQEVYLGDVGGFRETPIGVSDIQVDAASCG